MFFSEWFFYCCQLRGMLQQNKSHLTQKLFCSSFMASDPNRCWRLAPHQTILTLQRCTCVCYSIGNVVYLYWRCLCRYLYYFLQVFVCYCHVCWAKTNDWLLHRTRIKAKSIEWHYNNIIEKIHLKHILFKLFLIDQVYFQIN